MANKTYTAIFMPHTLRDAIKQKALTNNRTMIEELSEMYLSK